MKAIVSSKVLHNAIAKALNYDNLKVRVRCNELKFGRIGITLVGNIVDYDDTFDFIPSRWIEIMSLLYKLPEQPITIEFNEEIVWIYCTCKFKMY